jgi:hypothetical protein
VSHHTLHPQVVSLEPLLNDTQLPWVPSFITRQEASEQADDSEDGDDDEQELQKGKQVPRKAGKGGRAVTHVVVVNLDAPEGRDLLGQVGGGNTQSMLVWADMLNFTAILQDLA